MKGYLEKEDFIFNTKVYQKIEYNNEIENLAKDKVYEIAKKTTNLMNKFEDMLSFFKSDSEVSKINKNAGKCFTRISKDTFEILKVAEHYSKLTNGIFDITIAPLVKEWAINSQQPKFLTNKEVNKKLFLVDYEDVVLNESNLSVMLLRENQQIDLGGIAKGYIADKIIEFYKNNNVASAVINIGGNIKVLGSKDEENLWNVGIYEPKKHSKDVICSILVKDKSIVTSGGYERAFMYNGEMYNHILNPKNGYPVKSDLKSVTVVSNDSIEGDALSTPLFIMGKNKALEFMRKHNISGIIVTENDEIIVTRDLLEVFSLFKEYKVLTF